ncbi:MAG: ABC transporter permease [Actinomycetia bacterium]|jgi:simple sugar transport system permease protein|nr:ABC transporter permease [Actinomycetes bacterium]
MRRRFDLRSVLIALAAPVLAILFSVVVISVVLLAVGDNPFDVFSKMIEYGTQPRTEVLILNSATIYYFSAVAVAIGFKMNLFNIGVDGQYRLAAFAAAVVGGSINLPAPLHVLVILVTAVLVGAMWAGIAAVLRAYRGVSEVISTIMLNFIATGVIAYLLQPGRLAVEVQGSNNIGTEPIPPSGQVPGMAIIPGTESKVYGLAILAVLVGFGYWFLLNRTRFGFDLRATGMSESAAVSSGVDIKRMIVAAMLLSGAVAGLVGMPQLLGSSYSYSLDFPAGLGFTGIAIALLGRNNAVGIAFGALLWGFLDNSAQILDLEGVPKEIVTIMQGTIVLSVVIAYELVRRYRLREQQRLTGQATAEPTGIGPGADEREGAPA